MAMLVVIAATVAFAAAIQSTMGFGFALVAVPIIAVAEDPKVAVVAVTAIGVPMTLWNTIRWRAHLRRAPVRLAGRAPEVRARDQAGLQRSIAGRQAA